MKKTSILALSIFLLVFLVSAPAWAQKKKVKVAFALLWTIDDMGWTTAAYNGIKYLQEKWEMK